MPQTAREIMTDQLLFSRIQKGNEQAFKELFTRYYGVLLAYAHRFVNDEDAKEIVQDVMAWLWENNERLEIGSSLRNYLFTSVKNRCLTLIAHNEVKQRVEYTLHESLRDCYDDPDFYVVEELRYRIEEAIARLPETYRESFVMNRFELMTYQQIADQLNVSSKTVDYRIGQALKILRRELKDFLPVILSILY